MDWSKIATGLTDVAAFIESDAVTEAVSFAGPQASGILKIVQSAAELATNVTTHAESAAAVINTNDLTVIRAANRTIQDQNDALSLLVSKT